MCGVAVILWLKKEVIIITTIIITLFSSLCAHSAEIGEKADKWRKSNDHSTHIGTTKQQKIITIHNHLIKYLSEQQSVTTWVGPRHILRPPRTPVNLSVRVFQTSQREQDKRETCHDTDRTVIIHSRLTESVKGVSEDENDFLPFFSLGEPAKKNRKDSARLGQGWRLHHGRRRVCAGRGKNTGRKLICHSDQAELNVIPQLHTAVSLPIAGLLVCWWPVSARTRRGPRKERSHQSPDITSIHTFTSVTSLPVQLSLWIRNSQLDTRVKSACRSQLAVRQVVVTDREGRTLCIFRCRFTHRKNVLLVHLIEHVSPLLTHNFFQPNCNTFSVCWFGSTVRWKLHEGFSTGLRPQAQQFWFDSSYHGIVDNLKHQSLGSF